MKADEPSGHDGLRNLARNSKDVAQYYDDWAADYDETLADWQYEAPEKVAQVLRAELSAESVILDAGCGTGLGWPGFARSGVQGYRRHRCLQSLTANRRSFGGLP